MNHPRPWICLLAGLTSSQLVWLCLSANLSTMPMSKFSFILSTYYSLASWQVIRGTALQRSMKERSQLSTFLHDAQLFTVRISYWFLIFIPKKMSRLLPKMRGKTSFLCAWGFFTGKTYTTVRIKSRALEKKEKRTCWSMLEICTFLEQMPVKQNIFFTEGTLQQVSVECFSTFGLSASIILHSGEHYRS